MRTLSRNESMWRSVLGTKANRRMKNSCLQKRLLQGKHDVVPCFASLQCSICRSLSDKLWLQLIRCQNWVFFSTFPIHLQKVWIGGPARHLYIFTPCGWDGLWHVTVYYSALAVRARVFTGVRNQFKEVWQQPRSKNKHLCLWVVFRWDSASGSGSV